MNRSDLPSLPVQLRDILGYILPGATPLAIVYVSELWMKRSISMPNGQLEAPISQTLELLANPAFGDEWLAVTLLALCLLALAYVLGHLIATVRSFFIDRVLVYKGYGYPYENIFKLVPANYWTINSRYFYRGLFFWLNMYLLSRYILMVELAPPFLPAFGLLNVISVSAIVVLILAKTAARIITTQEERDFRPEEQLESMSGDVADYGKRWRSYMAVDQFAAEWKNKVFSWLHIITWAFSVPHNVIGRILHGYINTRESFHPHFARRYRTAFRRRFSMDSLEAGHHNHWLPYLQLLKDDPVMWQKVEYWRTLALFSGNLGTAFYLVFLYWLVLFSRNGFTVHSPPISGLFGWAPLAMGGLAILLLLRFYYFYYSHFSKILYRTFMIASDSIAFGGANRESRIT